MTKGAEPARRLRSRDPPGATATRDPLRRARSQLDGSEVETDGVDPVRKRHYVARSQLDGSEVETCCLLAPRELPDTGRGASSTAQKSRRDLRLRARRTGHGDGAEPARRLRSRDEVTHLAVPSLEHVGAEPARRLRSRDAIGAFGSVRSARGAEPARRLRSRDLRRRGHHRGQRWGRRGASSTAQKSRHDSPPVGDLVGHQGAEPARRLRSRDDCVCRRLEECARRARSQLDGSEVETQEQRCRSVR